jgi:PAS domain S-box-containing protein
MDSGGIYIVDPKTGEWDLTISCGLSSEFIRSGSHYEADSPHAGVILAGEPVYRNREEMSELLVNVQTKESLTALAILPVSCDGKIIASLNVASHVLKEVPAPARNTLEAIAAEIGSTIRRLRTEAALKDSLQTSADIVNSIPSGLFLYQFVEPDRLFLIESNPEAERLTSVSAQEYRDKEFDEIWPNAKTDGLKDAFLGPFRNDKNFETEDVHYKDDRLEGAYRTRTFKMPGNKLGVAFEDITDRKQAEEALRNSELRFRELSELLPQTIFELNLKGMFTYTNKYGLESTGYTWEDVKKGVHVLKLFMPEDHSNIQESMAQIIQGAPPEGREYSLLRKDGSCFPAMVYASRILRDGQPVGVRGIAVDMTETKRLQEFADRAHRLETAGRIAGQVAHDFNNLLGPLVAYPELVKEELGPSHPATTYLNSMESVAQQMADINQQLLTLGRRGHYNLEALNLNDTIREVVEQIYPRPSTLAVETNLDPDLMNINAGVAQIYRVVSNLVVNAVDAMQGIGTLAITTDNWYADDMKGNYGQIPRGEYVKLTITDTGCGIPHEALSQIFEPFFTSKKADKKRGSGLGLSVVHAVVDDHHGYVDLESQIGEGTSVYLYFPITRAEVANEEPNTIRGGSELILVVDDDTIQRDVTSTLLGKLGYQVRSVESGEKAIEFLKGQRCDLLLLDMIMPGGMNGCETFQQALNFHSDLKAVIFSGYAESEHVTEAQNLGAGQFLKKPLTLESLAQAVRSELDRVRSSEPVS